MIKQKSHQTDITNERGENCNTLHSVITGNTLKNKFFLRLAYFSFLSVLNCQHSHNVHSMYGILVRLL